MSEPRLRSLVGSIVLVMVGGACSLERHEVAPPWADAGGDGDEDAPDDAGWPDVSCAEGEQPCFGECVDPWSDPDHCGDCGIACGLHADCLDGECVCGIGFTPCPTGCAHLDNDRLNCGACGRACPEGMTCRRAECGPG